MSPTVLPEYGLNQEAVRIEAFGSGLINDTWKVFTAGGNYILQRVNDEIFTKPIHIAENIRLIADHLKVHYPAYRFIAPVTTLSGKEMLYIKGEGYFRLFPFVDGSHSKDVVETPEQAYEAATQFGRFTRLLSGVDVSRLKTSIPSFHDLSLRYQQFLKSLEKGNKTRIKASEAIIHSIEQNNDIEQQYRDIKSNPDFKLRVTHHDTKISNVLFDGNDKGICVIDLDTVMPGYFISDVGDMMRTYLSPVSEEEADVKKIQVREAFYQAIVKGYYNEMKEELTDTEKNYFFYAGVFMVYMQALRFLTDHLNNDVYYGAKYEGHNFVRATNQVTLLNRLMEKKEMLCRLEV